MVARWCNSSSSRSRLLNPTHRVAVRLPRPSPSCGVVMDQVLCCCY